MLYGDVRMIGEDRRRVICTPFVYESQPLICLTLMMADFMLFVAHLSMILYVSGQY